MSIGESASSSRTFFRAATTPGVPPWRVVQQFADGWVVVSVTCTSASGASQTLTGITAPTADASITLAAGDVVTCTFVNARPPTTLRLALRKETVGGVGGPFGFIVRNPAGATVATASATTVTEGIAVLAGTFDLAPGSYTLSETLPPGLWSFVSITCNGVSSAPTATGEVAIGVVTAGSDCTVRDQLSTTGSITIDKTTIGGTGTASFVVDNVDKAVSEALEPTAEATTIEPGQPVTAQPLIAGLPLGTYTITELGPPISLAGTWSLTSATCGNGQVETLPGIGVVVTLTPDAPTTRCSFVNTFVPAGSLQVVKLTVEPNGGRTAAVVIAVACGDGTTATLTLPASQSGPATLAAPIPFIQSATCSFTETATGAVPPATVKVETNVARNGTIVTTGGAPVQGVAVGPSDAVVVTFLDIYDPGVVSPITLPPTGPPAGSGTVVPVALLLVALGAAGAVIGRRASAIRRP